MARVTLPDLDVERIRRFARRRCPEALAREVRLEVTVKGMRVSLHERRPPWIGSGGPGAASEWTSSPVAQLRYTGSGGWTLFFADGEGAWSPYPGLAPRQPMTVIIEELESDPSCVFWG